MSYFVSVSLLLFFPRSLFCQLKKKLAAFLGRHLWRVQQSSSGWWWGDVGDLLFEFCQFWFSTLKSGNACCKSPSWHRERELYRFVHQSTLFVCCEVEDNIINMQLCHWCLLRLGIKLVLTVKQRICLVEWRLHDANAILTLEDDVSFSLYKLPTTIPSFFTITILR